MTKKKKNKNVFKVNYKKLILWFNQLSIKDVSLVGGKNASLGEMYRKLSKKGIVIPNGFAITAEAFDFFLRKSKIRKEIFTLLKETNKRNLSIKAKKIRHLVLSAELPKELQEAIIKAYHKLSKQYGVSAADVAVRSSATAEDLPNASFAGQQESFLNIYGERALLESVKRCFASLYTDRAISYRIDQ